MKTKFKILLLTLVLLWSIAFIQTCMTRLYVSRTAFTQAFARNQIQINNETEVTSDTRNTKTGNECREGTVEGRLSAEERAKVAHNIFREFGGEEVLDSDVDNPDYYVAYGYTSGVEQYKRVNNKKININVAMSYDEQENKTRIIVGTPLINSDF